MPSMPAIRARLQALLHDPDLVRVYLSFWFFGLINNIFYVIILTAALDLVGPAIPKATVLVAGVIPSLATKFIVPYIIHLIPYGSRIVIFAVLSTSGMLAVALSPPTTDAHSITAKLAGIVLANISAGAGEVNFLALTHYYGPYSLAAWGSGTGGAGLIGAGAYALATTTLGISVRATLVSSATLPLIMLVSFFAVLPLGPLRTARMLLKQKNHQLKATSSANGEVDESRESDGLLEEPDDRALSSAYTIEDCSLLQRISKDVGDKLHRVRLLVIPYMVPLFLVYLAEYTINQGVAPTLLFPLSESPFAHYRAFYPTYSALYQAGVFVSRSSLPFFRIRNLYIPSLLQVLNLVLLTAHAINPFLPNVWFVFLITFWEGLLGGLVYVSTFAAVREDVPAEDCEFSLGAVTVSDSGGIFVAGIIGAVMERALCNWQVNHGRDWCQQL